jgi:uncharacterized protein YhaN
MIFREIHIDGFGIFNDFSLTSLGQGINVILGNNETGKSTLLKFIRYTLFGYPKSIEQRMAPLNGGEHRGRIVALLSDSNSVTFERSAGSSGGPISMLHKGKSYEDQALWSRLLGNATKEIFENIYAFSLDELADLNRLSASGVEDRIFSVSLGLGNISINEVEESIKNQIDDIYTRRGRGKQILPLILKQIDNRKQLVTKIQDNLPRYRQLSLEIEKLETDIKNTIDQLKKYQAESGRLNNYLRCYNSFINIAHYDDELSALPGQKNYPGDGSGQLNDLERRKRELDEKMLILKKGNTEQKGIEELEEEIRAVTFNTGLLESSEKVEYLKANLEKYSLSVSDMKDDNSRIENLNKLVKQDLDRIGSKWTEQSILEFTDIISRHDRINEFKEKFNEIRSAKKEIEAQQKTLQIKVGGINVNSAAILFSIIFCIVSIALFISSYLVFGITFMLIALILFAGRKFLLRETSFEKIGNQLSDLNKKEKEVEDSYRSYLAAMNLDEDMTTDSVLEVFGIIGQAKRTLSDRDELKRRQVEQRIPFIREFESEVSALKDKVNFYESEGNIELMASQIVNEYQRAKEQSAHKDKLETARAGMLKELKSAESGLADINKRFRALLKSVNAVDAKDFRKKYEEEEKVKELIKARESAVVNIETVTGLGSSGRVIEFFSTNKKENVEKQKDEIDEMINIKSRELNNKNTELGEKKNEVRLIEGESELAEIMTELESERQKLDDNYKQWLAGNIALKLLAEVKAKYESERQPEVIKNSITHFSRITSGRYKKISVALDEKEVSVFDSREAVKKIDQLSRGTKEQLLVSLRLGFIEEYEKKAEPLPVIVDEVLVNFDPERAEKTAAILHEFAKSRQVLIFTCHPETIKYFKQMDINRILINNGG